MWIYKVQWYCESADDRFVNSGIVAGNSIADVCATVVKYYGKHTIINLTLFEVLNSENQMYEFDPDVDWTDVFDTDISSEF